MGDWERHWADIEPIARVDRPGGIKQIRRDR